MAHIAYTLPAPSDGLDLFSSIDRVPETNATKLINLYPTGTRCVLRGGLEEYADTSDSADTLINFPQLDGTEDLICGSNSKLYAITSGTETDLTGTTTPTSDIWQGVVFNKRLFLCNGVDTPQVNTGSGVFTDLNFTGGSTPTLSTLINVSTYKERLYFIPVNSTSVWYGNTKAIGTTALVEFPFEYVFKRGGFLVSCGSWTNQTGQNSQDLFYALSSEGEIVFYQGSSPSDTTWALVARFIIGKPLGRRAFAHVENDLWILTSQGIVPVSDLFGGGSSVASNGISRRVNKVLQEASKNFPFSHLYQAKYWAQGRRVYITYPTSATNTKMLVMNAENAAWCIYEYSLSGAAVSMEIHEDNPYFGSTTGKIWLAENNYNDNGEAINFEMRLGPNFFGNRGAFKRFSDIRPLMKTLGGITLSLGIDTNFQETYLSDTIVTAQGLSSPWDTSPWDTALWSEEERYLFDRHATRGQGHSGALRIAGSILDAPLEFNAFEIRFESGGQV